MKAILKFNLDDPDDRDNHKRMMKALDMADVLWSLSYNSKKAMENALDASPSMTADDALDMFYKEFYTLMERANINIEEIYS